MLDVKNQKYLDEVRAYADSRGEAVRAELEKSLGFLEHYRNDTCVCELYRDFAPHSFGYVLYGPEDKDGVRPHWLTGGVIHYAGEEGGSGAPQYSVSLSGKTHERWEVKE